MEAEPVAESTDEDLPVPFQNLSDAAEEAGQSVADFCADAVPGGSVDTPGKSGDNPSATAPGKSDDNPSETAPGKSDDNPSETAPGKSDDNPSGTAPGKSGATPGNSRWKSRPARDDRSVSSLSVQAHDASADPQATPFDCAQGDPTASLMGPSEPLDTFFVRANSTLMIWLFR